MIHIEKRTRNDYNTNTTTKNHPNDPYYHLKKVKFQTNIFHEEAPSISFPYEKCIDATYIIHLIGNGREENIWKQLSVCKPTETVYILYNEGFRKSNKTLVVYDSVHDLIDAYLYVMRDARKKGYETILIIEDDFIFDPEVCHPKVVHDIHQFLIEKKGNQLIYHFGTVPYGMIPDIHNSCRVFARSGSHCVVYSASSMEICLQTPQEKILDWDVFTCFQFPNYCYAKPLCYQFFTDTDNYSVWGKSYPHLSGITYLIKHYLRYYKLDTSLDGYAQTYRNALYSLYVIGLLCSVFVLLLFFFLFRMVSKSYKDPSTKRTSSNIS